MAVTPKLVDLCKIVCASTGTGAITLGDAAPGYRGREVLQNGETYPYSIQQESNFEYGTGVYLAASSQFVRTPDASSNGGAPIDLAPNAMIAFVARAEDLGRGEPGPPGPPGSSIPTLTALKGTDVSTAQVIYDGAVFSWTIADFTGQADDINIIESDFQPLAVGAWVWQQATAIRAAGGTTVQQALDAKVSASEMVSAIAAARQWIIPENYGAVGYSTQIEALAGPDYTTQLQQMADAAAELGFSVNGNGRWYKVSTISWPSGSYAQSLRLTTANATTDNAPFFIDGQSSEKSNITFVDCEVHGNRIGQTNITSSGGEGQRAGFKLFGRTSNVKMIRCKTSYCATDGFFIWTGTVVPANADDLLHKGTYLEACESYWNGRHGVSLSSHVGTRIIGLRSKNNGKDVPDWTPSGNFADGGYGRRTGSPARVYGRGLTHEGYFLGEHYEDWVIDRNEITENVSGTLLFAVMFSTKRSHKTLRVTNSIFDDPNGGSGDGCVNLYAVLDNGSGSRTPYTGTDAFDGVFLENNIYRRNYINMRCVKNWRVSGRCEMDPAVSVFSLNVAYYGPADEINLSGNGYVNGYLPPVSASFDYGTWTSGSASSSVIFPVIGGKHRIRYSMTATMAANTSNNFLTVTLGAGWVFDNYPLPVVTNNNTGGPIGPATSFINGNIGANSAFAVVRSDGSGSAAGIVWEPVIKAAGT